MLKSAGFIALWLVGSAAAVAVAWTGVGVVDDDLVSPAPAGEELGFGARAATETDPSEPATVGGVDAPGGGASPSRGPNDAGGSDASATATAIPPDAPAADPEARTNAAEETQIRTPAPTTPPTTAPSLPSRPAEPSAPRARATPAATAEPASTPLAPPSPAVRPGPPATPRQAATATPTSPPPKPAVPSPTATTPRSTPSSPPTPTTTPTVTAPPTPTPTPAAPPVQVVTFNLVGGSTAVSFAAGEVEVLWATPSPGFDVRITQESPGMKVEFRAEHHRSRIDVWWSGGPQHEIREEPDD